MKDLENEQNSNDTSDTKNALPSEETELESNAARRLRLLGIENDSKIHDQKEEITKGNFLANLWYKRKWAIIISAFFIIMAIILVAMFIFKDTDDMSIGYIGPHASQSASVKELLEPLVNDSDDDGKNELDFNASEYYNYSTDKVTSTVLQANDSIKNSFYENIRYNNFDIVLIDKSLYEEYSAWFYTIDQLIEMGANIDKEKHTGLFKDSEGTEYASAIVFNHTRLATDNKSKLGNIYSDDILLICFCKSNAVVDKDDDRILFLNNLLEYENANK